MKLVAALLVFLLVGSSVAEATFIIADELRSQCRRLVTDRTTTHDTEICHGYVMGVHDAAQSHEKLLGSHPLYCEPPRVTSDEMVRIVNRYLLENPELLQYSASSTVLGAFIQAFPCAGPDPPDTPEQ